MLGVDRLRIGLCGGISLRVRIRRCSISDICRIRRVHAGIRTSVGIGFSVCGTGGSIARIICIRTVRSILAISRLVSSSRALIRGGFHSGRHIFRKSGGGGGVAHAAEHGDRNDDGDYSFSKAPLGLCLLYSRMPHLLPPLTHRAHVHDSHLHHQSRIQPTRIHFQRSNLEQ